MIDDPLALILQGILLFAAGMYPIGFLFGTCSACCKCACGARVPNFNFNTANNSAKRSEDQADWCCGGSGPPQEITVRVSDAVSTASGPGAGGDVVTPFCDAVEGDYVLTLNKSERFCYYQYEPTCEVDCPEREHGTPGLPVFLPSIAIVAFVSGFSDIIPGVPSITAANFVEGPGYEFGVLLYARINQGGVAQRPEDHCGVYWGVPGEIEDTSPGGTGLSQASTPEPILLGSFQTGGVAQAFESSQCDMRGNFSGTMGGRPFSMTINDSHLDAGTTLSLSDCDALVFKRNDQINSWGTNTSQGYLPPGNAQARCDWDVEILAP